MGNGRFDETEYHSTRVIRAVKGIADFAYTQSAKHVHPDLDPTRIRNKPFKVLESCDSVEHPMSTAIIITSDVTGSNINNARVVQQKLPELMAKVTTVCDNPQIAIWANDDVTVMGRNAIQLGEFESDNRIDDSIRNLWLTGRGGANSGESYDLLIYAAARKTRTDCFDKRGKKGYMFLYADEPFFHEVDATAVNEIFGDQLQSNIPIDDIVAEAQRKWNIFVLWPMTGFQNARDQYEELFGVDNVRTSQSPEQLCDLVASIIAQEEQKQPQLVMADDDYVERIS
jgi:(2Fe-2S) ferredoxin